MIEVVIKLLLFILIGGFGIGKIIVINGIVLLFVELNGFLLDFKDYM